MHKLIILLLIFNGIYAENYWRPIFNGVDFTGWKPEGVGTFNGSPWVIRDGAIYGENIKSQPIHGICWSEKEYSDFTLRLKYKDIRDNSGFYFRSVPDEGILRIAGMQVEIDPTRDAGSFYETNGRNWVERVQSSFHQAVHRVNDWNDLIVEAHGTHITSYINGKLAIDLPNDFRGRLKGKFGLQTHGSLDTKIFFKDIEILDSAYCETDAACVLMDKICDIKVGSLSKNSCIAKPTVSIVNIHQKRLFITKNGPESVYDVLGKSLNLHHAARKFIYIQ